MHAEEGKTRRFYAPSNGAPTAALVGETRYG